MTTTPPSEHDIHAYVDGHLDDTRRSHVERYLARDTHRADEVQGWRQDAQQLRALLAGDLAVAPELDPVLVRGRARDRRLRRVAMAAAIV
ncbi:anti-sigma factor family protein, partial [Luteibacter yeojuensis]